MKRLTNLMVLLCCFSFSKAQEWTMQRCMQYAVEHNHEVKRAELELDNYEAAKTRSIGNLLPSASASTGIQYNFGRAIDPETNGYTDVSTFTNGYSLTASLPLFDGFSRLHALKAAQAGIEHHLDVHSWPTYKLFDRNGNLLDLSVDARNLDNLAGLLEQMK